MQNLLISEKLENYIIFRVSVAVIIPIVFEFFETSIHLVNSSKGPSVLAGVS